MLIDTFLSESQIFVRFFLAALAASQVVNKNEPMFISRSEAFKFAVGDVVTLPCEVTHPGNSPFFLTLPFFLLCWTCTKRTTKQ